MQPDVLCALHTHIDIYFLRRVFSARVRTNTHPVNAIVSTHTHGSVRGWCGGVRRSVHNEETIRCIVIALRINAYKWCRNVICVGFRFERESERERENEILASEREMCVHAELVSSSTPRGR